MSRSLLVASLTLLIACGDSDGGSGDTGAPMGDGGGEDVWPTPPALPDFGECPEGWRAIEAAPGVRVCDPTGPEGPIECPMGEAHIPGTAGCEPLGAACPAGEWPADTNAAGRALFVRPGASGAGTREDPFGTIQSALDAANDGDVVVLAKATFDEGPLMVRSAVTIRGACAAETAIAPSGEFPGPILLVDGVRGVRLEDFRIGPTLNAGPLIRNGEATITGVEMRGLYLIGLAVETSEATIERVAIRGSQTETASGDLGNALLAFRGATVTVRDSVLERNARGLLAESDATVRVEDTAARWTHGWFALGPGFESVLGARMELVRSECTESRGVCLRTDREGELVVDQVVVRDMLGQESNGAFGYGAAARGGTLSGGRLWVVNAKRTGIAGWEGTVDLTDVVVTSTQTNEALELVAVGVGCGIGASCTLRRAWLDDNGAAGVLLIDDVVGLFEDVTVVGTREVGGLGNGFLVSRAASLTVRRGRVEGNNSIGLFIAGTNGETRLDVTIEDLVVRGTLPVSTDGTLGRGLLAGRAARVQIDRMLVEGNREVAVSSEGPGTLVTGRDIVIRNPEPRACAETTCADAPGGIGAGAYRTGAMLLDDFTIEGAPLCAAQVAELGALELRGGEITNSAIGVCVQVPGFDLDAVTADVTFRDNEINVDQAGGHAVPEVVELDLEL